MRKADIEPGHWYLSKSGRIRHVTRLEYEDYHNDFGVFWHWPGGREYYGLRKTFAQGSVRRLTPDEVASHSKLNHGSTT